MSFQSRCFNINLSKTPLNAKDYLSKRIYFYDKTSIIITVILFVTYTRTYLKPNKYLFFFESCKLSDFMDISKKLQEFS